MTAILETPVRRVGAQQRIPAPKTLPGAIHRKCRCVRCRISSNALRREIDAEREAGTWQPFVDAEPVRQHVEALHDSGMSYAYISRVSGVSFETVRRLRGAYPGKPPSIQVRPDNAARLFAVRPHFTRLTPQGHVPNQGALRRIQALRAIGWPVYVLCARSGVSQYTLTHLHRQAAVEKATLREIETLYELLHDQDPRKNGVDKHTVRRVRRHAARSNWAIPAAWTDIDTDDDSNPLVRTVRFPRAAPKGRQEAVIADTAYLAAFGLTRERIAERIGITWNAIEQAHLRAGTTLPAALTEGDSHV